MPVRSVTCGGCGSSLPVGPGLTGFRLPPYALACPGCGVLARIGFLHRTTWLSWLTWKVGTFVLGAAIFGLVMLEDWSIGKTLVTGAIGGLFLGISAASC